MPASGLDAVLVAVELVLEHASPSGQISVEHIQNVLARLKDPQRPAPVHQPDAQGCAVGRHHAV